MMTEECKVSFLGKAGIDLADNERLSLWEPSRGGAVGFENGSICIHGKWRLSGLANFICLGLLGELVIKPLVFLRERSEAVPLECIERIMVQEQKKSVEFYVFQSRDGNMIEVHAFRADKESAPPLIDGLRTRVPAELFHGEACA